MENCLIISNSIKVLIGTFKDLESTVQFHRCGEQIAGTSDKSTKMTSAEVLDTQQIF